jgi:putative membrane protein
MSDFCVSYPQKGEKMPFPKLRKQLALSVALPFLALGPALAQMGSHGGSAPPVAPSNSNTNTANQPANVGAGTNYADASFVHSMLERDIADLQIAALAKDKSQTDDIKQLGERITTNRTALDDEFKPVAKTLDVGMPKGPSKKDKKDIEKLQSLSGPQFDQEFLDLLAKAHKQDIKDFQTESTTATDPTLQQITSKNGAPLAQQLQQIQEIAQAHNITLADK